MKLGTTGKNSAALQQPLLAKSVTYVERVGEIWYVGTRKLMLEFCAGGKNTAEELVNCS